METTGLKDKNGKEIFVGSNVRFKFYGQHFFTEKVHRTKNGFYPFDESTRIEVGMCVKPNECIVVDERAPQRSRL